ncbi:hypothetical protein [Methylomonas rhizoryzae]|uniref:hypothetical protein n=1 Tax=Methylomonas rhizoryzae TaxID=2608981 RepID=UPI001232C14C|nr:hypothetical protein [Methylomonas rhizoryzae]
MKREDRAFINQMVRELEQSIRNLAAEEQRLVAKLGEARVAELLGYWQKRLPADEEEAFKLTLDHDDKKLTWIWFRLRRARQSRAQAGQALMRGGT